MVRGRSLATHSVAAWMCVAVPLVVGLSTDLISKHVVFDRLNVRWFQDTGGVDQVASDTYVVIPNYLTLQAHVNYGAVFGIGQGARVLFLIVSVLAISLLGYLFSRSGTQRLYQVLIGILLAGVLGNLYDRAVFGYVRDMIYALPEWRWSDVIGALPKSDIFPWIFNVADSLLCVGVGSMFVYTMLGRDDVTTAPAQQAADRAAATHAEP